MSAILKGRDIVCLSFADWHGSWSTPQQVMSRLAHDNRVLYVDQPRSFLYLLKPPSAKGEGLWHGAPVQEVQPGLHVFHPPHCFLPTGGIPLPIASRALRLNGRLLAAQLKRVMKQLGFKDPILWNYSILHGEAIDFLSHTLHVYDIADVWEGYITNEHGRRLVRWEEERLTRAADIVFPSTEAIQESHLAWNPRHVLVPHGADFEHFAQAADPAMPLPEEFAKIPRPIAGFVGVMDPARFDEELLFGLAQARPDWSFVLVGPALAGVNLTRLQTCANVYLTGNKPIEQLPNYLKGFDVGMIPYRINPLTNGIFPLKLMEYLSAEKPVVSTPMTSVKAFGEVVYIAGDVREYADALDAAVREDGAPRRAQRQAVARQYSWEEIVRRKSEVVAAALAGNNPVVGSHGDTA